VKTPNLDEIEFVLGANYATTAGHSSNQVSTILGLGMFLSFYSVFKRLNFAGNRLFDMMILVSFTFQGLLSFSRGGMIVGVVAILLVLFLPETTTKGTSSSIRNKSIFIGATVFIALYGVFEIANIVTKGNLYLRYQGETQGTLLGSKEITVDHFLTGRIGIFEQDVHLWINHIFTGVGCGSSRYIRDLDRVGVAAHIELSRLLADHGLLGLIYAILFFIVIPLKNWRVNADSSQRIILITLIVIATLTTFHAAMRTFLTPLFIILGSLKISDHKINPKI
jgi:hypothetical protein